MILRRVIEHVKAQNWFAVGLDFLIVVAGVFIGTQVSDWNSARHDRARAEDYAERLENDLTYQYWRHKYALVYYEQVRANAREALNLLAAAPSDRRAASDEALLISAYRASQYFYVPQRRATFDELVATGDIRLIADSHMREAAVVVFADNSNETVSEEAKVSDFRRIFRQITPAAIQDALLLQCGDKNIETGKFRNLATDIGYPCALGFPAPTIAAAAERMRSNGLLIEALQLRLADLETAIVNINTFDPRDLPYFQNREKAPGADALEPAP